jgi:hypothetical protein
MYYKTALHRNQFSFIKIKVMFHFRHKTMMHNAIHMKDSCFIHIILHCKQLIVNRLDMKDILKAYPP